jgi:hypothetical protein
MSGNAHSNTASAGRVVGRPFVKGRSGNPAGRPRATFDFTSAARAATPEVLEMFLKSIRSSNWRERHSAGIVLLDRAFGKPTQPIVGEDGGSISILHLVAMREIGEAIIAELVTRQTSTIIDGHPVDSGARPPGSQADLSSPATE